MNWKFSFISVFPVQSPVECLQASKKTHRNIVMCLSILKVKGKVVQSCLTLSHPMDYTVHGILQARILEWIVLPLSRGSCQQRDQIQVSSMQADSLPAEPQRNPRILEWVAYHFSRGYSPSRKWTRVSCIAGGFFTSWATRESILCFPNYGHIYISSSVFTRTLQRMIFFFFYKGKETQYHMSKLSW